MPITRGIATETSDIDRNGHEKGPALTSGDETKQRRPRHCWGSTVKHSVLYFTLLGRRIQESITRFREKFSAPHAGFLRMRVRQMAGRRADVSHLPDMREPPPDIDPRRPDVDPA